MRDLCGLLPLLPLLPLLALLALLARSPLLSSLPPIRGQIRSHEPGFRDRAATHLAMNITPMEKDSPGVTPVQEKA